MEESTFAITRNGNEIQLTKSELRSAHLAWRLTTESPSFARELADNWKERYAKTAGVSPETKLSVELSELIAQSATSLWILNDENPHVGSEYANIDDLRWCVDAAVAKNAWRIWELEERPTA